MKKLYIVLSGFLCFSMLNAAEQSQDFNAEIQADLSKLEADIAAAEKLHEEEQKHLEKAATKRAEEEDQAIAAAAILEKIKKQTEQQTAPVAEPNIEATQEDINLEEVLKGLEETEALKTTEEEILQEQSLQHDIQEALKTAENIEAA